MPNYYIVMSDVISSHSYDGNYLSDSLSYLVSKCNQKLGNKILSPYTITLGDEFQGILGNLKSAVESIFFIEEFVKTLAPSQLDLFGKTTMPITLRYSIYYGEITSEINPSIAHGMLGKGLTQARNMLNDKKTNKHRFKFGLDNQKLSKQLNGLFFLLESLIEKWKHSDYPIINEMLINENDHKVGEKFEKNRSQVWKRRKSLRIEDYKTIKTLIFDLIQ